MMTNWLRAAVAVAVVTAAALVVLVVPASAGVTNVSGIGLYDTGCVPPAGAGGAGAIPSDTGYYAPLALTGSLIGCWYTYVTYSKSNPSGTYQERGTELFVGCLNGTCGTFNTTYTFTGKFTSAGAEIHGRCQHAVVSGHGGFTGVSGVVTFKDDVVAQEFPYRGNIKL